MANGEKPTYSKRGDLNHNKTTSSHAKKERSLGGQNGSEQGGGMNLNEET